MRANGEETIMSITLEYCLLAIDWWPLCMTKGEWSGWMQAIGTVLAILAAVGVAYVQHRQNLAQQRITAAVERGRALAGPLAMAERTAWRMEQYLRELKVVTGHNGQWGAPVGIEDELQGLVESFASLKLESLPSYETIHAAHEILDLMRRANVQLRGLAHTKDVAANLTRQEIDAVAETLNQVKAAIDVLLVEWRRARAAEIGLQTTIRVSAATNR